MVKRKLKLAQVVCAVYTLNKPDGATKSEIIRFCKLRFGSCYTSKEIEKILEKGLDEGLLTTFSKRYQVTKLQHGILWAGDSGVLQKKKRAGKKKQIKGTKAKVRRKANPKRRAKRFIKGKVILEDCIKQTSSLYQLWKKELKRQISKMKGRIKTISKRGKSLCKKMKGAPKPKRQSHRQKAKETGNRKRGKVEQMKNALRIKRHRAKEQKSGARAKKGEGNKKSRQNSRGSSNSIGTAGQSDRYRSLLRQTKHAVVHGKSWDRLNFTRQKRVRENQEMVKNSQLVQKILTQKHGSSWDDLNSKLKHMKEKASCSTQEGRANGDGASQHSMASL